MGLFDRISTPVDEIAVGFNLPANTYEFVIDEITLFSFKEDHNLAGQHAIIFKLKVIAGAHIGKTFDHFVRIPDESLQTSDEAARYAGFLKTALDWYGVPESFMNKFDPENPAHTAMIIGKPGKGTLKKSKKGDYINLSHFELDEEESGVSDINLTPDTEATLEDPWATSK